MEGAVRLSKKTLMILVGVVVVIIAVVIGKAIFAPEKSPEQIAKEVDAAKVAIEGWRVKHDARLEANKDKIRLAKQALIKFYDAESGALAEQQRLIDVLIAADNAQAENDIKQQKITSFRISDIAFEKLNVGDSEANIIAKIEYYIKYDTQARDYSTFGSSTFEWKLKKVKNNWKIIEEKLIPGDEK